MGLNYREYNFKSVGYKYTSLGSRNIGKLSLRKINSYLSINKNIIILKLLIIHTWIFRGKSFFQR